MGIPEVSKLLDLLPEVICQLLIGLPLSISQYLRTSEGPEMGTSNSCPHQCGRRTFRFIEKAGGFGAHFSVAPDWLDEWDYQGLSKQQAWIYEIKTKLLGRIILPNCQVCYWGLILFYISLPVSGIELQHPTWCLSLRSVVDICWPALGEVEFLSNAVCKGVL